MLLHLLAAVSDAQTFSPSPPPAAAADDAAATTTAAAATTAATTPATTSTTPAAPLNPIATLPPGHNNTTLTPVTAPVASTNKKSLLQGLFPEIVRNPTTGTDEEVKEEIEAAEAAAMENGDESNANREGTGGVGKAGSGSSNSNNSEHNTDDALHAEQLLRAGSTEARDDPARGSEIIEMADTFEVKRSCKVFWRTLVSYNKMVTRAVFIAGLNHSLRVCAFFRSRVWAPIVFGASPYVDSGRAKPHFWPCSS